MTEAIIGKRSEWARSSEEAEVWWRNYQAEVHKSVLAAEQHLEVPAGTISSIPNDPDFIATVKMYAVVEPILNELIASRPPQEHSLAPRREHSRGWRLR